MGTDAKLPDQSAGVNFSAANIPWTLEPVAAIEFVDLLTFTDDEIRVYARDVQWELESLRRVLHQSLAALARATVQADRYQARIVDLIAELRAARQVICDLRATQDRV